MKLLSKSKTLREYRLSVEEAEACVAQEDGWLHHAVEAAQQLPGGWVKREQVTRSDGQTCNFYTPRPYVQGYGCDGSTTGPILWIARQLCRKHGLHFTKLMEKAYPKDPPANALDGYGEEVALPGEIDAGLALDDLTEINYHQFRATLEDALQEQDIDVKYLSLEEREHRHARQLAMLKDDDGQMALL